MASTGRNWLLPLIVLFLVVTGITWPFLDDEDIRPESKQKDVVILSWKWNKSVAGDFFAVQGEVENTSAKNFQAVTLILRTVDDAGDPLGQHGIPIGPLEAGQRKLFREDVPRSGKEAAGVVEVAEAVEAP